MERGRPHNESNMHTDTSPRKDISRMINIANQLPAAEMDTNHGQWESKTLNQDLVTRTSNPSNP